MIRAIIVFNEFSDSSVIENIGGIVVDNLRKMDRLLIADIPEEKIQDLRDNIKIKSVQIDSELIVEHATSNSDPHLHMDGNSYIQLPSMTYTAIELDVVIDKTTNNTASRYIFDNRSTGIAYFYSNSSNLEVFYNCNVYINGVMHTDTSGGPHYSIIPDGQRTLIRVELPSAVTSPTLLFSRTGLGYYAYGDIYSVKVYNSSTVVAEYDMSNGNLNDTTGNGNNAVLTGGQWVGLSTNTTEVKESFSKYDGGLQWGLISLRAKDYWDRGITGKGLKVGIMDVGFYHHNYLRNDYIDGIDYSGTNNYLTSGNSGLMHGLEVTSQIDSDFIYSNSGFHSGICRNLQLYGIKLYDGTYPKNSEIVSALNWSIEKDIKILNFSSIVYLNQDDYSGTLTAIDTFVNNDGIIFMSAGNQREEVLSSTSLNGYSNITLVGGIDINYKRWDDGNTGSNYGQNLSFMTIYGDLVYKTNTKIPTVTDEIGVGRGTSYSSPLAVGIFALYKEAYHNNTNHEVLQIMKDSAKKIDGRTDWDMYYGYGLLQPNDFILSKPRIARDNGLKFNGAGDYVNCGSGSTLDISNNLSIILEFSQEYGNDGYLIAKIDPSKDDGPFYGLRLGHDDVSGNKIFVYYNTGGTFTNASYPISLSDTERYRLAVVYNYPNILVYINGILYTTISMSGSMSASTTSSGAPSLYIGSSAKNGERSFNGIMYEVKIYKSSLSDSDIASDYNGNKIDGAILNYKFNGTETTTVNDLSSYSNNGTIFGAKPNIRRNT